MAFLKLISTYFAELITPRALTKANENLLTQNKLLEQQLSDTKITLAKSQSDLAYISALYNTAFYASSQLYSVSEVATGKFIDVNDTWLQTRGFSREEAIGKTADELNIWGSDAAYREKILDDINTYGHLRNYETQSVMRSGEIRDFILNAEILEFDGKQLLFFSGMDVTESKLLERNLQRSQKLDAVGQLSGGIAHDFNNLLGIILGNLELLAEQIPDDEKLQTLVDSAIHGAERGAKITKKLLSFSSDHSSISKITDINELILHIEDLIAKSVTAAITLKTQLAEGAWLVNVDPSDFEDAIINLSINAYDAMPNGGTLCIETYNTTLDAEFSKLNPDAKPGDYLAVSVEDNGTGLSDDIRDRVFEPFFTTKNREKGTGLGLSMVFGFIKRAKGHIQIKSGDGTGTNFILYLPRSANQNTELDTSEENLPLVGGTETILIVDDEFHLTEIAQIKLRGLGYKTYFATDGDAALKILKEQPDIDLMFSDIVMPGTLSGYDLAVNVREKTPQIKILLTSGYSRADELLTAEAEILIGDISRRTLPKPYTSIQLATAIRTTLDTD
ncbi:MAG: ATP-binding protein [Pseudomonas marincola]